ncbi:MAG: hypothetical protein LBS91_04240 [Clostridiales Family XIII bacterium]|jgi:spore germination protein YaaH|nr:hypothetical protein [Clostridiales Family XIII bacterium]
MGTEAGRGAGKRTGRAIAPIVILAVLAALLWFAGKPIIEQYTPNQEPVDLRAYLGLSGAEDAAVFLGDDHAAANAIVRGGAVYWDADSVKRNFAGNFWWDKGEGLLLLTTADEVVRAEAGVPSYTRHAEAAPGEGVSPEIVTADAPVFLLEKGRAYISLGYALQFSNFAYELFPDPYRVQIYAGDGSHDAAAALKKTALHRAGDIKSGVVRELQKGETVYILSQMKEWSKVKTRDALVGFVENRRLSESAPEEIRVPQNYAPPPYTALTSDKRLCIAWHQVSVYDANAYLYDMIEGAWPLDVISPTWYSVSDASGAVTSIASRDYVAQAHARGLSVWALVSDFADGLDREALLASTESRNTFVSYMVEQAGALGFDGINLDFELVPASSAQGFEQLLRELSVACRAHGLVFSVDNYPPRAHTEHYNRSLQGEVADYVVVMGYDEHWGSSSGAGSVASLPFAREAIELTLDAAPANKTINAVPFYTRIWNTARDGTVSASAVGQKTQAEWIEKRGLEPIWDETLGQHYTQIDEQNKLYQVWLEDESSMQARIDMMKEYGLGGVAGWRLGLESEAFWDILGAYTREGAG